MPLAPGLAVFSAPSLFLHEMAQAALNRAPRTRARQGALKQAYCDCINRRIGFLQHIIPCLGNPPCLLFHCIADLQDPPCLPCSPHVPPASLEGLTEFSHCWVLYVFHCNTDLHKLWQRDQRQVKALVRVPRLNGEARGTLATRTPHRPLPIGVTCLQKMNPRQWALCLTGSSERYRRRAIRAVSGVLIDAQCCFFGSTGLRQTQEQWEGQHADPAGAQ